MKESAGDLILSFQLLVPNAPTTFLSLITSEPPIPGLLVLAGTFRCRQVDCTRSVPSCCLRLISCFSSFDLVKILQHTKGTGEDLRPESADGQEERNHGLL